MAQPTSSAQETELQPTVIPPFIFNASADALALREAMRGLGTNEDTLINVLCRRTKDQRMEVLEAFNRKRDLISDIKSETSGSFQDILVFLLTDTAECYANEVQKAISAIDNQNSNLFSVICPLSNEEIKGMKTAYQKLYEKDLDVVSVDSVAEESGKLISLLLSAKRDESNETDMKKAKKDAETLKGALSGAPVDVDSIIDILCSQSFAQIKLVHEFYVNNNHSDKTDSGGESDDEDILEKHLLDKLSKKCAEGLVTILRIANNRSEFFSAELFDAMPDFDCKGVRSVFKTIKRMGATACAVAKAARTISNATVGAAIRVLKADDNALIRLVVTRSEIDMKDIKKVFEICSGKSLKSFIKRSTCGDFQKALLTLIDEV